MQKVWRGSGVEERLFVEGDGFEGGLGLAFSAQVLLGRFGDLVLEFGLRVHFGIGGIRG